MTDFLALVVDVFGPACLTDSHWKGAHKLFGFGPNAIGELVLNVFRPNRAIAVGALRVNSRAIFDISFIHIGNNLVLL
jgi:hypothetical protein